MSEFNTGDRVHVEFDGEVHEDQSYVREGLVRLIREGDNKSVKIDRAYITVTEPAYEAGEVYRDEDGDLFYRERFPEGGRVWRWLGPNLTCEDDVPAGRLVKLVPAA